MDIFTFILWWRSVDPWWWCEKLIVFEICLLDLYKLPDTWTSETFQLSKETIFLRIGFENSPWWQGIQIIWAIWFISFDMGRWFIWSISIKNICRAIIDRDIIRARNSTYYLDAENKCKEENSILVSTLEPEFGPDHLHKLEFESELWDWFKNIFII